MEVWIVFFFYIQSNLWICVTQTGGAMDSRAACSLWTAMRWPSRCITERGRKTDTERKREREAAAAHQNWPTCILSFSLSLAYADLQFAFTLQHRALLCWSWEQTTQRRRRRFVRSHSSSRVHRCYSCIGQQTKEKEEKRKFVHHMFIHLYSFNIHRNTIKSIYVSACAHEQREDMNDRRKSTNRWKMTTTY
jgi:hypothetical protein